MKAHSTIDLHIREASQLFDSFDPCPFYERDLDAEAEDYIVASVRELRHSPSAMVIHLDQPIAGVDEAHGIETAIHQHFRRKVKVSSRELHDLLRRGGISLAIGSAFLVGLLSVSKLIAASIPAEPLASVLRESLVIGGWVAMWRPLEIFLYAWWPIASRRRTLTLLSQIPIETRHRRQAKPRPPSTPMT